MKVLTFFKVAIFVAIFCSCSQLKNWYSPKRITISAQEIYSSPNKAIYLAEKTVRQKALERGCNLSKGYRSAWSQRVGSGYRGSVSYILKPKDCDVRKCLAGWTQQESRSQAGGWIWFPGQGKGKNIENAELFAKGRALNQLVQECEKIPKEAKFHERCVDQVGTQYVVKVRVSVQNKYCLLTKRSDDQKYVHKELTKLLGEYRKSLK